MVPLSLEHFDVMSMVRKSKEKLGKCCGFVENKPYQMS